MARLHVGLNVRSLKEAVAFYEAFLGGGPTKIRPGYAKFELADPALNLTLNEGLASHPAPGTLSHLGIEVVSTGEVLDATTRLRAAGLATEVEREVACCYAVQDKVWVTDPDGNRWEVFVVLQADMPQATTPANPGEPCCAPQGVTAAGGAG